MHLRIELTVFDCFDQVIVGKLVLKLRKKSFLKIIKLIKSLSTILMSSGSLFESIVKNFLSISGYPRDFVKPRLILQHLLLHLPFLASNQQNPLADYRLWHRWCYHNCFRWCTQRIPLTIWWAAVWIIAATMIFIGLWRHHSCLVTQWLIVFQYYYLIEESFFWFVIQRWPQTIIELHRTCWR